MALTPAASGTFVARAQFTCPVTDEPLQHAIFDQNSALRFHSFVVHRQGAEGSTTQPFIDGGDGRVSDQFTNAISEGSGAAFDLGCFEQMPTGLVENDATKAVSENSRHLSGIHVVGTQHRSSAVANLSCAVLGIPVPKIIRTIGTAIAAANAGPVVSVCGENREAGRLMQADVAGEGAIGRSNQDFLPVAGVTAATHLKILTQTLEMGCAVKQALTGLIERWAAFQPVGFGQTVVGQPL